MDCETAIKLVQLTNVQQEDRAFAHTKRQELLRAIFWTPNISNCRHVQFFVEYLSIKRRYVALALCSDKLHRYNSLSDHSFVLRVTQLALLQNLLK